MPSIIGAGSQFYPSGSETVAILTSGASSLTLTAANINNPVEIVNQAQGGNLVLPSAATAALVPGGSHFGGVTHQGSFPLSLFNGGVAGTEAVLEKVIAAGTFWRTSIVATGSGTAFGTAYSSGAGLWNFYSSLPPLKTMVPLVYNTTVASGALGASGLTNATSSPAGSNTSSTTWLSPTLGLVVYTDTANNIKGVPFQLSAAGVGSAGTATQIAANGGNALTYPIVSRASANAAVVSWGDSTNTKNLWAVVTVTSGVTVPTMVVGAAADDTAALPTAGTRFTTTQGQTSMWADNNGPNQWIACGTGATNANRVRIAYLVANLAGSGTVVLSATSDFDSGVSPNTTVQGTMGCSISAAKTLILGNVSTALNLYSLTYSASAITSGWVAVTYGDNTSRFTRVDAMDTTQNLFVTSTSPPTNPAFVSVQRLDLLGNVLESETMLNIPLEDGTQLKTFNPSKYISMGDGEYFGNTTNSASQGVFYVDLKTYMRGGNMSSTPSLAAPPDFIGQSMRWMLPAGANIIGYAFEATTRRIVVAYTPTINSGLYVSMNFSFFQFPKR